MTTTATYPADCHWDLEASHSRRCSTETVFSVQDRETDFARDTSDSEDLDSDGVEYEPVTASDGEAPIDDDTSAASDDDIIRTKVLEVCVADDQDVQFADSERTDTYESDSDYDFKMEFGVCLRCKNTNTNPIYSYCQKCYHIRKNFFPPRPKRKRRNAKSSNSQPPIFSRQASSSGYSSHAVFDTAVVGAPDTAAIASPHCDDSSTKLSAADSPRHSAMDAAVTTLASIRNTAAGYKRRAGSADLDVAHKKLRYDSGLGSLGSRDSRDTNFTDDTDDTDADEPVQPLVKTVSDPLITIDSVVKITKKAIANTIIEKMSSNDLCVVCVSEPKSGVFVHGRIAHICCCYKCAVKVWTKAKRCPVCNCKVSNVLRAVVM